MTDHDAVDPATGYLPGREPGSPHWDGLAGDELRRLERLALADLRDPDPPE